jgi:hypothetical protein
VNGAGGAPDPRLRFRVYIGGRLVDETWVDCSAPGAGAVADAVQARHEALAADADHEGVPWVIEVYDPEQPDSIPFRLGTDPTGMVLPVPATPRAVETLLLPEPRDPP